MEMLKNENSFNDANGVANVRDDTAWQIGTEIIDVKIEDIDGDGLKDVQITSSFIEA